MFIPVSIFAQLRFWKQQMTDSRNFVYKCFIINSLDPLVTVAG